MAVNAPLSLNLSEVTGTTIRGVNTNSGGVVRIAARKVLTSDVVGNGTWQAIPAITGSLNLTSATTTFLSNATGTVGNVGSFTIDYAENNSIALTSITYGLGNAGVFR